MMSLAADLGKASTIICPQSTQYSECRPPRITFPVKYRLHSRVNTNTALVKHNHVKCRRKCTDCQQPLRLLPNVDIPRTTTSYSNPCNYASISSVMNRSISSSRRDGHCTRVSSVQMPPTAESSEVLAVWDSKQGLREEMEDELTVVQDVPGGFVYAGVFDGHGGHAAARFLKDKLYGECLAALEGGASLQADDFTSALAALRHAFEHTDRRLLEWQENLEDVVEQEAGSTAVVVFLSSDHILTAWTGDSRAVLCQGGEAVELTEDHRPNGDSPMSKEEIARIKSAGGWISSGRVCGNLAVSRAFGDMQFKTKRKEYLDRGLKKGRWTTRFVNKLRLEEEWVTATPTVRHTPLPADADFVLLGSDGLWDAVRSSEAVRFVKRQLDAKASYQAACDSLMKFALEDRKADDNISLVLIPIPLTQ